MARRFVPVLLLLAVGLLPATATANVPLGSTALMSRPAGFSGSLPAGLYDFTGFLTAHAVSQNGRYVVFMSTADGMAPNDNDGVRNVYVRDTQTNTTTLVSAASDGTPGNGDSEEAVISADGTAVAFRSFASNLVSDDSNGETDVFVHYLTTGKTGLVSRQGPLSGGAVSDGSSGEPAIDATGTNVAFASKATNLSSAATDGTLQVYRYHFSGLASGPALVSRATGSGGAAGDRGSSHPAISSDGSKVAFDSDATNLSAADTNGRQDIYERDLSANTTTLVSRGTGVNGTIGDGDARSPAVSDDGTKVAFETWSDNVDPADTNTNYDLYLRDISGNTTKLVSRANGISGAVQDGNAGEASIDSTGNLVAFASNGTNLGDGVGGSQDNAYVHLRNVSAGTTALVSRLSGPGGGPASGNEPALSADGTRVAFNGRREPLLPASEHDFGAIFVRDLGGGQATSQVSLPTGTDPLPGVVNSSSTGGVSADGRYVVFSSDADVLFPGDDQGYTHCYLRDNLTGDLTLVDRAPDGSVITGDCFNPRVTPDGKRVAFEDDGSVVPEDSNGNIDVYVRDLPSGTTILASRADGPDGAPAGGQEPAISGDGNRVAFRTFTDGLAGGDANGKPDVYVRDLGSGRTFFVAVADDGTNGTKGSNDPSLDGDGHKVVFDSDHLVATDNDLYAEIYMRDIDAGTTILVSRADGASGTKSDKTSYAPQIDTAGDKVAFRSVASNLTGDSPPGIESLFVRDLSHGSTALESVGSLSHQDYAFSAGGHTIAFSTNSAIAPEDTNNEPDVYLRNLDDRSLTLVSRASGSAGAVSPLGASNPAVGADGGCVAFESASDNLTQPSYAGHDFAQVYLRAVSSDCPALAPQRDTTPPVISSAKAVPPKFVVGQKPTVLSARKRKKRKTGTKLVYTVSESSTVTIRFERPAVGRKLRHKPCSKATRRNRKGKRCTYYKRVGALTRHATAGTDTTPFTGRIGRRALKPGRYRVTFTAVDAAGNRSAPRRITITVLRK